MSNKVDPTTLEVVKITPSSKERMGEVKTGEIHDGNNNFHPDGLFSATIFGRVGSEERMVMPGYINLNINIMQPILYKHISDLGSLYVRIMEGKEFVIFNEKLKDFEISSSEKSSTGFSYFIKHLPKIVFKRTGSKKRDFKIRLVEKLIKENNALTDSLIVIPAGLRDYIYNKNGRPEEDEINTLYRRVIARTSLLNKERVRANPDLFDEDAIAIQKSVFNIFVYISELLKGKHKLIQNKWTKRRVFNTTSNVVSSYVNRTKGNDDPRKMGYNDTRVGLFQYARSTAPLSLYNIKNKYIPDIFPSNSNIAYLTNAKTLEREEVSVAGIQKDIDLWTTNEGLEKIIASLMTQSSIEEILFRSNNKDYYMGLIYQDENYVKFFQDIRELPEGYSKDNVRPVKLYDFVYMSMYHMSRKYYGFVTRYPITGYGSIYPTLITLVTTSNTVTVRELDAGWNVQDGNDSVVEFFPIYTSGFVNTINVSSAHLAGLGGDFDGDTLHLKMVLSQEATEEIRKFLGRKEYYISDDNRLIFSTSTDVMDALFKSLTY